MFVLSGFTEVGAVIGGTVAVIFMVTVAVIIVVVTKMFLSNKKQSNVTQHE